MIIVNLRENQISLLFYTESIMLFHLVDHHLVNESKIQSRYDIVSD